MNIRDYALLAVEKGAKCGGCCGQKVQLRDIRSYDHSDGWRVDGFLERQWLYFQCPDPSCHYQTSFAKIGIARPVPTT